ncbi:MAG: hypothetical protein A3G38_00640 [Omnitrophica WOR_2 bacterium RIFCSPLOWO2_12_FULL_51_8]|nr:MAG: hypothetical protein A3G38_00640 [Omnitrophica WOR_2 bacterium RIFCSPLOWO2_12_FULL_51_8]
MRNELLKKAVDLGQRLGRIFLTTADNNGVPHLSIATKISINSNVELSVAGWFCPGTVANLESNPNIGVTIWDAERDIGYQLLGKKDALREVAMLDGYVPEREGKLHLPQVEREVAVKVEKIFEFKQVPHNDSECKL